MTKKASYMPFIFYVIGITLTGAMVQTNVETLLIDTVKLVRREDLLSHRVEIMSKGVSNQSYFGKLNGT